ncbi:MAG: GDSL-type esterase/lipase family protein [Actinomycetota bacterium]
MQLQDLSFVAGPVEVRGALELDRTPGGLLPRRLPAWTRPQIPDIFMHTMVTLTAGVRIVFATDSPVVELVSHPRTIHQVEAPLRQPVYQLIVDGQLQPDVEAAGGSFVHIDRSKGPSGIEFEVGGNVTTRWDRLGTGTKEIEIWLPTHSSVELVALRIAAGASAVAVPVSRPRWVHYGSSISHCVDVDRPFDAWPPMVSREVGVELTDFGLAGQCQLDPFMGRVLRDVPADFISVKLGINLVNAASMTERTFGPAVHGLLDHIRDGHPDTPLLVISPIFCPIAEDHPGPTVPSPAGGFHIVATPAEARPFPLTLRRIREMLAAIVEQRRAAGDSTLSYLDGLTLFGAAEESMLHDRLHPSPEGYALIGRRFADVVFGEHGPFAV